LYSTEFIKNYVNKNCFFIKKKERKEIFLSIRVVDKQIIFNENKNVKIIKIKCVYQKQILRENISSK
jgi:hypothetical protein